MSYLSNSSEDEEYKLQRTSDIRDRSYQILNLVAAADDKACSEGFRAPSKRNEGRRPSRELKKGRSEPSFDRKPAALMAASSEQAKAAQDDALKEYERLEREMGSTVKESKKLEREKDDALKESEKLKREKTLVEQHAAEEETEEWDLHQKANLILSLVGEEEELEEEFHVEIDRRANVAAANGVALGNRTERESDEKGKQGMSSAITSLRRNPGDTGSTILARATSSSGAASTDTKHPKSCSDEGSREGRNDRPATSTPRKLGRGEKASSISQVTPPPLTRNLGYQQPPGALRVPGIVSNEEEDELEDSAFFSVTADQSNYPAQSASEAALSAAPVQAKLVEEIDDEAAQLERELAERERKIREREFELEKKLKQMEQPVQAVQAQVVTDSRVEKKKSKGIFGFFKRGASKSKSVVPPKTFPFSEVTDNGWSSALVNDVVAIQLGTTSKNPRADSITNFSQSTQRLDDDVFTTVPIFKADEILEGKQVGKCKNNVISLLKSIKLDEGWAPTAADSKPVNTEKQIELRKDAATTLSSKKGTRYTIKRVRSHLETRRRDVAALQLAYESSLLLQLSHENIMKLSGISEGIVSAGKLSEDQCCFTITEMVEDNLSDRLAKSWSRKIRGPQLFLDRLGVATSLASALSYLHSQNIVYFDLKPENVGFDKNGALKLHNFCAAYELKGCIAPYDLAAFTSSPFFVGTHPYVAPEVVLKHRSGLRSDVYGFSIILWEIMTLKEAFEGLMIHEYTRKVIQEQKRPKVDKKTPAELNGIMSAGWQHEPSRRPCMKAVHEFLLRFQEEYRATVDRK
jgi:serine/threonine protein kinase